MREHIDRSRGGGATPIESFHGRVECFDHEEEGIVYAAGLVLRLEDEREACTGNTEAWLAGERGGGS